MKTTNKNSASTLLAVLSLLVILSACMYGALNYTATVSYAVAGTTTLRRATEVGGWRHGLHVCQLARTDEGAAQRPAADLDLREPSAAHGGHVSSHLRFHGEPRSESRDWSTLYHRQLPGAGGRSAGRSDRGQYDFARCVHTFDGHVADALLRHESHRQHDQLLRFLRCVAAGGLQPAVHCRASAPDLSKANHLALAIRALL